MNAVVEFLVHFGTFRNVDLFRQGLYALRASVRADEASTKAIPYHMPSASPAPASALCVPASIGNDSQAFTSRSFRVQYCDQEIALGESCLFRLELRAAERSVPVYLDVDLMHAEYSSTDAVQGRPAPSEAEYERVSTRTLVMASVFAEGVHALYPLTFDDSHFCAADVMVHSALLDYRFRPVVVARPPARRGLRPDTGKPYERPPPAVARSLEEYVYRRRVTPAPFEPGAPPDAPQRTAADLRPYSRDEVVSVGEKHHRYYVHSLAAAYNGLAETLAEYVAEMLGQGAIAGGLEPAPLELGAPVTLPPKRHEEEEEEEEKGSEKKKKKSRYVLPRLAPMSARLDGVVLTDEGMVEAARVIADDLALVGQQSFALWNAFYEVVPKLGARLAERLRAEWEGRAVESHGGFVFRETAAPTDRWKLADPEIASVHAHVSSVVRRAAHLGALAPMPLVDEALVVPPEHQTVLFDLTYDGERYPRDGGGAPPGTSAEGNLAGAVIDGHFDGNDDEEGEEEEEEDGAGRAATLRAAALAAAAAATGQPDEDECDVDVSQLSESVLADHSPHEPPADGIDIVKPPPAADPETEPEPGPEPEPEPEREPERAALPFDEVAAVRRRRAKYKGRHLVVLVHGYQGNSWDMRLFKNRMALLFPGALYLLSAANEGETEGDIGECGQRLAREVDEYVMDNCRNQLGRLSFVAHSMGGVVVRAALRHPLMRGFLPKLYNLVTLATPHCGYLSSSNALLDTGIWVLKKWTKSVSLSQLSMADAEDPHDSFMYRLSEARGLEHFEHVFLVASLQDKYVPFHSARVELHEAASRDRKRGNVFHSMVSNLMANLDGVLLKRIDVSFVPKKKNLDSFIGRTAHIFFLDQELYMHILLHSYKEYFL